MRRLFFSLILGFVFLSALGAFWFKWPVDWFSENGDRTLSAGTMFVATGASDSITSTTPWAHMFINVSSAAAASSHVLIRFKTALGAATVDSMTVRTYADKYLGTVAYAGPLPPEVEHILITSTGTTVRIAWVGLKNDYE